MKEIYSPKHPVRNAGQHLPKRFLQRSLLCINTIPYVHHTLPHYHLQYRLLSLLRRVRALGSNFVLKDGNLDITLRKQYQLIEKGVETIKAQNEGLELTDFALDKTKTAQYEAVSELMSG